MRGGVAKRELSSFDWAGRLEAHYGEIGTAFFACMWDGKNQRSAI